MPAVYDRGRSQNWQLDVPIEIISHNEMPNNISSGFLGISMPSLIVKFLAQENPVFIESLTRSPNNQTSRHSCASFFEKSNEY